MNDEWCLFLFYEISVFPRQFIIIIIAKKFLKLHCLIRRSSRKVFRFFFFIHLAPCRLFVWAIFVKICLFEGCNVDRFGGELKIVSDFRWLFRILICFLFLSTCREFLFHFLKPLPVDMFGCPGMASFVCCFAMGKKKG